MAQRRPGAGRGGRAAPPARWDTLVDLRPSPGLSDEAIRVYLARDLTDVADADRHVGTRRRPTSASTGCRWTRRWRRCFAGDIENSAAVAGLLAAAYARDRDWAPLRPADAPWAADPTHRADLATRPLTRSGRD